LYRAAAHAALGEPARAIEIVAEALANAPNLETNYVDFCECYRDPATKRTLIDFLARAGLPPSRVERSRAHADTP
jgi:hypothetical protein